jgi:nucleoside-diphosphate-sugar epimerase
VSQTSSTNIQHILVTGGCGYIGSQLIRAVATDDRFEGTTIRVLDNMQRENYHALMDLPERANCEFIEGDILDPSRMKLALEGIDAVIHLAAVVRTPLSFDHPARLSQVNHWGTAHLVEHCLDLGVPRFILASSASVYGPGGTFDEEDACKPIGPYAQSKFQAEQAAWGASRRGLNLSILRIATVYGYAPSMRFDSVANRFAYLAGVGRPITVFGTGQQTRPLVHVRDVSHAISFCLSHPEETQGRLFNVVEDNFSVLDMVAALQKIREVRVRFTEQDVLTHFSFALNPSRLKGLGWGPLCTLENGFAEMVEHFRRVSAVQHPSMESLTEI